MITFHSRQSDCARRARKNENAGTFNFISQIASSICTVAFTKCEKSDATIFTSRCSRTTMCYRLYTKQALPLVKTRFLRLANSSPKTARSPARRSRDGREPSGKKSGECLESYPRNVSAMAGQWQRQCHRTSVKTTCKTTCLAADLAAPCPRRKLARRLASNPNHDIQKL